MGSRSTDFVGKDSSTGQGEGSFAEGLARQTAGVVRHLEEVIAKVGCLKGGGPCFLGVGSQEDP